MLENDHFGALAGRGSIFIDFLLNSLQKSNILGSWPYKALLGIVAVAVAVLMLFRYFFVICVNRALFIRFGKFLLLLLLMLLLVAVALAVAFAFAFAVAVVATDIYI